MTASPHQPALILWDIDHTLVTIGEVSREIYANAFEEVVGQPLRELPNMTGRTERAILAETLALHGVLNPESKFDDFYAGLSRAADKLRERMRTAGRRLPGAVEAITALAERNVVQTVVTGNIKPIAVTKLEVFQLSEHMDLEVGGYGSDGDTRPPLIRQAWQRAQLARLNGDMASLGLRIMEGSASAVEQTSYARRLIAAGERLRRRANGIGGAVIEGEVLADISLALPAHTVEPDWEP